MDGPPNSDSGAAGADAGVSPDKLWHAMEVVWGYIKSPQELKNAGERCGATLRATCRDGRVRHDKLVHKLLLKFTLPDSRDELVLAPQPWQVRDLLTGMFQRGQPLLRALVVRATVPKGKWRAPQLTGEQEDEWTLLQEQRCLAMFEAIGSYPNAGLLTHLEMDAGPWLTADIFVALAKACPNLTELKLVGRTKPNAATEFGVLQLYNVVGPRLKALHLRQLDEWRPVLMHGLRLCTGLGELTVNVQYTEEQEDPFECDLVVLRTVSKLTSLKRLELSQENVEIYGSVSILSDHASDLSRLSALTGLTKLALQLNYYTLGDPTLPEKEEEEEEQRAEGLRKVYQAQQAALGCALRRMPNLTHLALAGPPLCTGTLATLTALTHLVASRLAWPPAPPPDAVGTQPRPSLELPPKLDTLWLLTPQRLDVLSALRAPPTDLTVRMGRLKFEYGTGLDISRNDWETLPAEQSGVEFVFSREDSEALPSEEGGKRRLLPAAVECVRRVVGMLAAASSCRPQNDGTMRLYAEAVPRSGLLLPPAAPAGAAGVGAPGHAVWIRELGPVQRPLVALRGLELVGGDLECLAATLPEMKVLVLRHCAFDMAELSAALSRHTHLRYLALCPERCTLETHELVDLLLTLCQQSPSLRRLMLLSKMSLWAYEDRKMRWSTHRCHDVRRMLARGLEAAGVGGKVKVEVEAYGPKDDFDRVRLEEWDEGSEEGCEGSGPQS